jgi:5'-3' exonuclease
MDCNSIIYDAVYKLNAADVTEHIADQIITKVIESISNYIQLLKPSNNIMIAFDGVAPVAKLEQQRSRRFKSQYINQMSRSLLNSHDAEPWNTAAITPGTYFMKLLDEKVKLAFADPHRFNVSQVVFTGSNEFGEGEHKIFEYIRQYPSQHNNGQNTIIYGLDADLIMLSIHHLPIANKLYLFRETPEFIKSIQN